MAPLDDTVRVCARCSLAFERVGGILDTLGATPRTPEAAAVEAFYDVRPFPGYDAGDDGPTVIDRSRRSPFLVALDAAIASDATVVDCGCGTGQLAAFLALGGTRRRVIGIDMCLASLRCADQFRRRARIVNLQLMRADLLDLPLEERSYGVVLSRGVVHHTSAPERAIESVARLVAPGGTLLLGFYETAARLAHRARRVLGKALGRPLHVLDPVLRRRDLGEEKKRTWIADQYQHPLEHCLPLPHVVAVLERLGFRWVRTVPPACDRGDLFHALPKPSAAALRALRTRWLLRGANDQDAGLVFIVARRALEHQPDERS